MKPKMKHTVRYSEPMKAAGQRLKAAREAKGLSQVDLGYVIGVRSETVSRWENGAAWVPMSRHEDLAKALGVKLFSAVYLPTEAPCPK